MYSIHRRAATRHPRRIGRSNLGHEEEVAVTQSSRANSTSPKRKAQAALSPSVLYLPAMSGDYQVLRGDLDAQRTAVLSSRAALASSLDRLGEHHVRQKEYDNGMDAFTEALQEKRSILSSLFPCTGNNYFNSIAASIGNGEMLTATSDQQDTAIDEVIRTLRNMGNVHSLRGEQDEAMRYFTEVTNLRATKTSSRIEADENSTHYSGFGPDEDTLMSEINEDVKALDDMFRSISFRNHESSTASRQSKKIAPLGLTAENSSPSNKRRKGEKLRGNIPSFESEPFRRSSSLNMSSTDNQLTVALDAYRTVLESYEGTNLEEHKETLNSLALRVDLTTEGPKGSESSGLQGRSGRQSELELAIEIYQQVLAVQQEVNTEQEHAGESNQPLSARIASTLIRMGSMYYKLGDRLEELRMYKEAKTIYKKAFGENHKFVAGARKNIGMVLAEQGEYGKALEQFEKARLIYIAVQEGEVANRDVASAISCMGNVKNRVGELDDALEQYMNALKIYKSIQQKSDDSGCKETATLDVTATLKVVGMVHSKKGDLDMAMGFFTEAMALLKSSGVDKSASGRETSASVLTRMAGIYVKKNELDHAMEFYRDAYELIVHSRGTATHQDIAGILHYIGGIFHKRSDYEEAMNCYQEAIRIYHATLGPCNPAVAGTLVMVGSIHYKRRNLDSAMMFYREALRLNRDTYGLHHPDVAPILKSIGTILTKKGEYRDAYDVFRDVLSIKCTIHGMGDPEVASAYKSLGNVHYKLGELADAERQYRHALSIYRQNRGEDHPDTVGARTTIEHIRYWMKERGQEKLDTRQCKTSGRSTTSGEEDERSC
jgi:tetratricopeptide (TPR) repeat protein